MRLFGRNDLVLLLGLTAAMFVVMSQPVARVLDYVRDIEQTRGLRLLPGLVILATVFICHQLWKRQEMRAAAQSAAAVAAQATERAADLERLVAFGQSLAQSLHRDSIRASVSQHMELLADGRATWAMVRTGTAWSTLVATGDSTAACRERAARHSLGERVEEPWPDDVCFKLLAAGNVVGVLGVSAHPPLTDHQRSMLNAGAALLAVSLKNAELFRDIQESSVTDALTGCVNRTHALAEIDAELGRAERSPRPVALLMFDLDHFKDINDTHGHLCGDAVLASVGDCMRAVLRGADLKARYGGEEFLVMLPDTPVEGARRVAEKLRTEIARHSLSWNGDTVQVTASFGVTAIERGETDALTILARADAALYRAKEQGRNRTVVAGVPAAVA